MKTHLFTPLNIYGGRERKSMTEKDGGGVNQNSIVNPEGQATGAVEWQVE